MKKKENFVELFIELFDNIEKWLAILLSAIILIITISALYRVFISTYGLVIQNLISPASIDFKLYTDIFGKILTLLISIEFMNAIVDIAKKREIKKLLIDVIIITGLALCRKLIVLDYHEYDPMYIFAFGFVLIALGALYYLISTGKKIE